MSEYKAPEGKMIQVADGVYAYMQNAWLFHSNAGLIVGKDYAIVVDSLTNRYQTENFLAAIKSVTDKPVRMIINTHWHTDHIYTNHMFPGAISVMTSKTRDAILEQGPDEASAFASVLPPDKFSFEGAKLTMPDIVFDGELELFDGVHHIKVVEMGPGHSCSDSIVVLEKENCIFLGDMATEGTKGCITPVANLWSGSYSWILTLHKTLRYPIEHFVPGHGGRILGRKELVDVVSSLTDFMVTVREECYRLWKTGINYRQAADQFNYDLLRRWSDDPEALYNQVYADCARAWEEFEGQPDGVTIDVEDCFGIAMLGRGRRLNLGRHDKRRIAD